MRKGWQGAMCWSWGCCLLLWVLPATRGQPQVAHACPANSSSHWHLASPHTATSSPANVPHGSGSFGCILPREKGGRTTREKKWAFGERSWWPTHKYAKPRRTPKPLYHPLLPCSHGHYCLLSITHRLSVCLMQGENKTKMLHSCSQCMHGRAKPTADIKALMSSNTRIAITATCTRNAATSCAKQSRHHFCSACSSVLAPTRHSETWCDICRASPFLIRSI